MAFQGDSIYWVEVEKIVPNPYQPRREFDEGRLQELAESIRMYGVLQPLTVTRREVTRDDGTFFTEYELIAGERRLRASRLAGLQQVPVIIRSGEQTDQEKLELAIIENLQREDLNSVDRALAFKQLAELFNLSHAQVAKKVGRSREYVSNTLRLLQLPEYMLTALKTGDMSEGHGRTLLMLNDRPEEQDTVFREILLKKLSVREVERIARKIATEKVRKKDWGIDPVLIEIEKRFTNTLGTRVQIQKTDYGGKLTIDYFTNDDLEKLLDLIEAQEQATNATLAAQESPHDDAAKLMDATPLVITSSAAPLVGETLVAEVPPTLIPASEPLVASEPAPEPLPVTPSEESTPANIAQTPVAAPVASVPDMQQRFIPQQYQMATPQVVATPPASPLVPPVAPASGTPQRNVDEDLYGIRNFNI
jgi:ParB family transcriptional regulator, chromosome partitioning protein